MEVETHSNLEDDFPYASYTNNSSSSDIVSPVTPTFSAKGHFRGSSSTSSLDLAYVQLQDIPSSPTQQLSKQSSKRQLPDVEEEPLEREEDTSTFSKSYDLYCLCEFSQSGPVTTTTMKLTMDQAIHNANIPGARSLLIRATSWPIRILNTIWVV